MSSTDLRTAHDAGSPGDSAGRPVPIDLPVFDEDPFGDEILSDPEPFHAAVRDAGPLVYLRSLGVWAMGRYDDVYAALTDWQGFQSAAGVGLSNFTKETPWRPPSLLLEADPPHHDAPRAVLSSVLGPRALRRLQGAWRADAEELVDEVLSGPHAFDAVEQLANRFPLRVFPDAVGLPHEGRENLLPYGDHAFNAFGPRNGRVIKGEARMPEISGWIGSVCTRNALAETGFGAEIWAAADRGEITEAQAPLIVRSLLTAGVDTTVHAISSIIRAITATPGSWQRLREDPALIRTAFDEAIRLQSPVQTFFRTTTRDITAGGAVIPEGEKVLLLLGSANHDPRRWDDPLRFSLDRDPSGHVGFGMGLHQCVGQHVARFEAEALFTALVDRVEDIHPAGEPRLHLNNTLIGWASVPVKVVAVP